MRVTIVCGPTASGKTDFAHNLARSENAEIICIDSMQLYRALPILTASPEQALRSEICYHLYNSLEAHESSSMASYVRLASAVINDCINRNKMPILVGGTGLYINALVCGYSAIPEINQEIRAMIRDEYDAVGHSAFIVKLNKIDPQIKTHLDKYRAIRAMEVILSTGRSIKTFYDNKVLPLPAMQYCVKYICLDKDCLVRNIAMRLDKMLLLNVIEEVRDAITSNDNFVNSHIAQAIGARQVMRYLESECSMAEMIEQIQIKTWQYAKRQRTWFAKMMNILALMENVAIDYIS